jgi:hypothetical protein
MIFLVGGGYLSYISVEMIIKRKKYMRYIELVVKESQYSIFTIARILRLPQEYVIWDLQEMIDKGYFKGAYIDKGKNEMILVNGNLGQEKTNRCSGKEILVICEHCGASKLVCEGAISKCEYCDSYLQ